MAEILVKFNTTTKTLTASIDGKELENVYAVSGYLCMPGYEDDDNDEDEYDFCITTCSKDEESGIHTHTRISAAELPSGKSIASQKDSFSVPELPGFIAAEGNDHLNSKVASYLEASRNSKVRK